MERVRCSAQNDVTLAATTTPGSVWEGAANVLSDEMPRTLGTVRCLVARRRTFEYADGRPFVIGAPERDWVRQREVLDIGEVSDRGFATAYSRFWIREALTDSVQREFHSRPSNA